jgi:hypothetical protein
MNHFVKTLTEKFKIHDCYPVGSRVTCDPAPTDTDEDYIILVSTEKNKLLADYLLDEDFNCQSDGGEYDGISESDFLSWKKDELNLLVTTDLAFFHKFMAASSLAKHLNLLKKEDRIATFQVVLYGKEIVDGEAREGYYGFLDIDLDKQDQ